MDVLVATDDGLISLDGDGARTIRVQGEKVVGLATDETDVVSALTAGGEVWRSTDDTWDRSTSFDPHPTPRCLLPTERGLVIGTAEARLLRLTDDETEPVRGFDDVEGRADWYTPWGGPPDVRSLARGGDGTLYANVHVGGILRSTNGEHWTPTGIDIDADVHEVVVHPGRPDVVLAACANGLAYSTDAGKTWTFVTEGLHATYARAIALSANTVWVSASTGPRTDRGALYRTTVGDDALRKVDGGLPEWFAGNVDTGWIDALGTTVAIGTPDGEVYTSEDEGASWRRLGADLGSINHLLLR